MNAVVVIYAYRNTIRCSLKSQSSPLPKSVYVGELLNRVAVLSRISRILTNLIRSSLQVNSFIFGLWQSNLANLGLFEFGIGGLIFFFVIFMAGDTEIFQAALTTTLLYVELPYPYNSLCYCSISLEHEMHAGVCRLFEVQLATVSRSSFFSCSMQSSEKNAIFWQANVCLLSAVCWCSTLKHLYLSTICWKWVIPCWVVFD